MRDIVKQISSVAGRFPFVSQAQALSIARIGVALLFAIHAIVRLAHWTIPQFALFMENVGFPNGTMTVLIITAMELVAAAMLVAGVYVRLASAILMAIAIGGIVLIHRHLGWFVGEHGTGGSEYSVALILLLVVVSASQSESSNVVVGS